MKRFNVSGGARKAVRHFKFVPVFLLVLITSMFTVVASAAELVVNGGFEEPDLSTFAKGTRAFDKGWTTFYGQNFTGTCTVECNGGTLIPGWSVVWTDTLGDPVPTPGRIEIQGNQLTKIWPGIAPAKGGTQKAELDTHDRVVGRIGDNNVTIFQELETCPNTAYTLTYDWKSRIALVDDNDIRVLVGNTEVRAHSLTDTWVLETVNFVTDGTSSTGIAFVSFGTGSTFGMSLDSVSVIGPAISDCPTPSCIDGSDDGESGAECLCPAEGGGRLTELTLIYDGDDRTAHNQLDATVVPDPVPGGLPATAYIKVTGKEGSGISEFSSGTVRIGDTFSFSTPQNNAVVVEIFDPAIGLADEDVVQTITFHTSCSHPLERKDTFGGITIWDGT